MLMKVFNKGQVVIPVEVRRRLGIAPGDLLEVELSGDHKSIILRKQDVSSARKLAGSLSQYGKRKEAPTKEQMLTTLASGLAEKRDAH